MEVTGVNKEIENLAEDHGCFVWLLLFIATFTIFNFILLITIGTILKNIIQ